MVVFAPCALVQPLLLKEGKALALGALPEGVGGKEEVAAEGLLVLVRVGRPRAWGGGGEG